MLTVLTQITGFYSQMTAGLDPARAGPAQVTPDPFPCNALQKG
jgi:hypothetical protein